MKSEERRRYSMASRAQAANATSERILDVVTELFWAHPTEEVVMRDVAERAGVTVQTVIRKYGGREGLLAAAADRAMSRTASQRAASPGDLESAIEVLLDHYEQAGPGVLRLLAAEQTSRTLGEYADRGRALHRDWCRTLFAPTLAALEGVARRRRLAQLVAVCDVYTWKLLRRDAGLSRRQTQIAILELLGPLVIHHTEENVDHHSRESR